MRSISLSETKARLTKILAEVEELGEEVVITRSGKPAGVLMPFREYEGLLETLEILADQELARSIEHGLSEVAKGKLVSEEEVWRGLEDPVRS